MNEFAFPDVEQLMKQGIVEVKHWLESAGMSASDFVKHGNWWSGLAESTRTKIFQESQPNMEWAQITISIYENMDRYSSTGCEACMTSSMMLRAKLINMSGPKADNSVLDIQKIVDWFFEGLPLTRQETETKMKLSLKQLADLYPNDLVGLRKIKNRLNVIKVLGDGNKVLLEEELNQWLNIRDKLP